MAFSVDQFGKALVTAGLFTADELKALWNAIPADGRPKQGDGFAKLLVQQGKLNQFQADELLSGRNTPLVMGDYLLVAELGAGGMGKVYKARHRRMERIVALKVMSTAAMQDEAAVKRFQREVKAAARLEHPNIVTAYDSGETGKVKYLVMQFVDGGDLSQLVKHNGPLEIERAVDYVLQAARGLGFAHGEGVVHRDIKPANLLLDKKGVVKILDMGLARIEGGDGLTATEQVMGTVDYMSPEQAANTKTADGRSDIYSLGCTLWFLLTAKKVYDGDTMISRLMSHRNDPPPSLVKARDDVPWSLEQAFHKMIAKSPEERFQSMDEVVAALEPFAPSGSSRSGVGSSIGMGPQSAEMASFLKSIGPAVKPQTKPAPSKTNVNVEATAQFAAAGADTDPKSQLLPPSKKAVQPQAKGSGKKPPPNKNLLLAAAGGGALLVLLGVWFIFRDKDGNEVARVQMPDRGSVTVQQPAATGVPAPVAAPTRPAVSFFLPNSTPASPSGTTSPPSVAPPTVAASSQSPAGVVYLDDLPEIEAIVGFMSLGKHGKFDEVGKQDQTIRWRGGPVAHSLFMHPRSGQVSFVRYQIDGRYATFAADVGISELVRASSPAVFRVLGDGRELWKSQPLQKQGEFAAATVDIRGVKELRLETSCVADANGCHATWFMPRLTLVAAPAAENFVYLDDLAEKSYFVHGTAFFKPGRNPNDVGALSKPFPGVSPVHALLLHVGESKLDPLKDAAPSTASHRVSGRIVYDLDGRFSAFQSHFRAIGRNRQLFAEVWGDGRQLWKSGSEVSTEPVGTKAEVDVRGIRELTILFWSDGTDNFNNHVLLIEPRLTPVAKPVGSAPPLAVAPFDAAGAKAHQQAWAKHLGTTVETPNSVGAKMVLIPPGEFLMGSTDEQVEAFRKIAEELKINPAEMDRVQQQEQPQHRVVITKPFRLSATEVTVGQFKKFVAATGYRTEAETIAPKQINLNTATDDLPTAGITWNDAEAYCKWLSEQEKTTYRLPTEAEWEFACRAGTATQYSFGDDAALLDQYEWNYKNSRSQLQSAGTKLPNAFGLFDMHGSLHEWCRDYFAANWYGASPPNDPTGPQIGSEHVIRGGNYWPYSNALQCRSAHRASSSGATRHSFLIGFRCVRELDVPATTVSVAPLPAALATTPSVTKPTSPAPPLAIAPFDAAQAKAHQQAWAAHLGVPVEFTNAVGMKFRLIPPGEFQMGLGPEFTDEVLLRLVGQTDHAWLKNLSIARPAHPVRITRPFYMQTAEVASGHYRDVLGQLRAEIEQNPSSPLTSYVAWPDAIAFCNRLSEREGKRPAYRIEAAQITPLDDADGYRLPTEAQWEYACRAGTDTLWYFGNDGGGNGEEFRKRCAAANPFGLVGLYAGSNEWCWDATELTPYSVATPSRRDDPREDKGRSRIKRGGTRFDNYGTSLAQVNSFARAQSSAGPFDPNTMKFTGFGRVVLPIASSTSVPGSTAIVPQVPAAASLHPAEPPSAAPVTTPPRWPLAPTKPEDIQWLLDKKCVVTVRGPSAFGNDPLETSLKAGDAIPSGSQTVVGLEWTNRDENFATDDDLARIATFVDLERLNFTDSAMSRQITSAGMLKLAALVNLRRLTINQCKDKAAGAESILQAMPHLEFLHLPFGTNASSVWAAAAAARPSITEIRAFRCDYLDANLVHFEKMSQLTALDLSDNALLTEVAVEKLAAAKQNCRIVASFNGVRRIFEPRSSPSTEPRTSALAADSKPRFSDLPSTAPAVLRWPLAPSKPEDIVWLQGLQATLTLRAPSAFGGDPTDVRVQPGEPLPVGAATIVGVIMHRDGGPQWTDAGMARLATLTDLETFSTDFAAPGAAVTKTGMAEFEKLTGLRIIVLGRLGTADTDYSFLERLPRLETLRLSMIQFPNWVDQVRRLSLRELQLYSLSLSRLNELKGCPTLTTFTLGGGGDDLEARRTAAAELAKVMPWVRIKLTTAGTSKVETIEPTAPPPAAASGTK